jgi:hypothetical protein
MLSQFKGAEWIYHEPQSSLLKYPVEERSRSTQPIVGSEAEQLALLTKEAELDVRDYNKKISWMRARVLALERERDLFEWHLESAKSLLSPIRRLPVEIVAEIFSHYCDQTTLVYEQVMDRYEGSGYYMIPQLKMSVPAARLGQVCWAWRSIAQSTPSLWATISLSLRDELAIFEGNLSQRLMSALYHVLKSSANHALDVSIFSVDFEETLHPAVTLLVAECRRWLRADLHFSNPETFCDGRLEALRENLPLLQILGLRSDDYTEDKSHIFSVAPCLHDIHIKTLMPKYIALPWEQLRSATVQEPRPEALSSILKMTPHLRSFRMVSIMRARNITPVPIVSDIAQLSVHNELQSLSGVSEILTYLTLPHLSKLQLSQTIMPCPTTLPDIFLSRSTMMCFFSNFSRTLSSLVLKNIRVMDVDLIAVLAPLIHLEALEICDHQTPPTLTAHVIYCLFGPQKGNFYRSILPALDRLNIDLAISLQLPLELTFSLLACLATSRSTSPSAQFQHVKMTSKLRNAFFAIRDVKCPHAVLETWESLRIGGLNVTIVDSSGVVDFSFPGSNTCKSTSSLYIFHSTPRTHILIFRNFLTLELEPSARISSFSYVLSLKDNVHYAFF